MKKLAILSFILVTAAMSYGGCNVIVPPIPITPTPTPLFPSPTPTITVTMTSTGTPTGSPIFTSTAIPTNTPTNIPTLTPTNILPTLTPTNTPTSTPTVTYTPMWQYTPVPSVPTLTPTGTPTSTWTPIIVFTATPTPTPTATISLSPTCIWPPIAGPGGGNFCTPTPTVTPTGPTPTPTATPYFTPSPTRTPTYVGPSLTPTCIWPPIPGPGGGDFCTPTPIATPTGPTPTPTPTATVSITLTPTPTPTAFPPISPCVGTTFEVTTAPSDAKVEIELKTVPGLFTNQLFPVTIQFEVSPAAPLASIGEGVVLDYTGNYLTYSGGAPLLPQTKSLNSLSCNRLTFIITKAPTDSIIRLTHKFGSGLFAGSSTFPFLITAIATANVPPGTIITFRLLTSSGVLIRQDTYTVPPPVLGRKRPKSLKV
jgi:hypothetical protein